jgi:hypothetical protein
MTLAFFTLGRSTSLVHNSADIAMAAGWKTRRAAVFSSTAEFEMHLGVP